jgi:hypothetical protein
MFLPADCIGSFEVNAVCVVVISCVRKNTGCVWKRVPFRALVKLNPSVAARMSLNAYVRRHKLSRWSFRMIKLFSNIGIDCFGGADVNVSSFGIALF